MVDENSLTRNYYEHASVNTIVRKCGWVLHPLDLMTSGTFQEETHESQSNVRAKFNILFLI